jgi:hypothetical protein
MADQMLVSQEGLASMEMVLYLFLSKKKLYSEKVRCFFKTYFGFSLDHHGLNITMVRSELISPNTVRWVAQSV